VARELSFVAHHGIHHMSMIKLLLQAQGYTVGEQLGLAPSTVKDIQAATGTAIETGKDQLKER
jgi:hypothetical protein